MLIVKSQSLDVYHNLAIEEYLMEHVLDQGPVLFLWQSECAVVVGKNQNPWRECRLDLMRADNVPLARRISGGGTVYHDAGNLNYCIIVDRREYREQQAYDLVKRALNTFGIRAEKTGKSNLSVDGLKFSGNAFCFRRGRAMHHGTLLLDTDLVRLDRYLGSMLQGIETHAIPSEPAQVTNLHLTVEDMSQALADVFEKVYGPGVAVRSTERDMGQGVLEHLWQHQRTKEWLYGASPKFNIKAGAQEVVVVKGRVVRATGFPEADSILGKCFEDIAFSLLC